VKGEIKRMKFYGRKIKIKRAELGINQDSLAKQCSIATSTLSGIEKHNNMPNLKILLKLMEVLKVPLDYFFSEKEKNT